MITGDHAATATAIARDLDVIHDLGAEVLTAHEVENMSDEELTERVGAVQVYARVSPDHRFRIFKALQSQGQVTAATGDGRQRRSRAARRRHRHRHGQERHRRGPRGQRHGARR